jgi:hypothetical protein
MASMGQGHPTTDPYRVLTLLSQHPRVASHKFNSTSCTANMKKESMAYSYEDQKWEVEMRKEIMQKKKVAAEQSVAVATNVRELLKKLGKVEPETESEWRRLVGRMSEGSSSGIPYSVSPRHGEGEGEGEGEGVAVQR